MTIKKFAVCIASLFILGSFSTLQAAIPPDLSYVDTSSNAWSRFQSWVNLALNGNPQYGFRATDAAYVYMVTGDETYCTLAIDTVETQVQEAEAIIAAGGRPEISGDSYLHVGPMIQELSLTFDWCSAQSTASQKARWSNYAEQAVWNLWNHASAEWGGNSFPWSGWSTDNPGNNYYYSFLEATLFWAQASQSSAWMNFLADNKVPPLVTYFQGLPGGGSLEGTGYGLSHKRLFHFYRIWKEATGQDISAASPHASDSIDYWLHATVPTFEYTAAIGDQARTAMPVLYDYHRTLVLESRFLDPTSDQAGRASWWLRRIPVDEMQSGFNFRHDLLPVGTENTPSNLFHHATGVGHLFARSSWRADATWMSFVAGPYEAGHAHQDQGSFSLFKDRWLSVTENVYTRNGIQQGVNVHNVIRFEDNGTPIAQSYGTNSMTAQQYGSVLEIQADLSNAYDHTSAVSSWQRKADFQQSSLMVLDTFSTAPGVEAIWQINTPVEPVIVGSDIVAGDLRIHPIEPANPTINIVDWTTVSDGVTYNSGWKVELSGGLSTYEVELSIAPSLNSCTENHVLLEGPSTYPNDEVYHCRAPGSIQTLGDITAELGAEVHFTAPLLELAAGFRVKQGAVFYATAAIPADIAP